MENDPTLTPLRGEPEFVAMLQGHGASPQAN